MHTFSLPHQAQIQKSTPNSPRGAVVAVVGEGEVAAEGGVEVEAARGEWTWISSTSLLFPFISLARCPMDISSSSMLSFYAYATIVSLVHGSV